MEHNTHISETEWMVFFSDQAAEAQKNALLPRVMGHISCCDSCRQFYAKARALRRSLRSTASGQTAAGQTSAGASAYAAVASQGGFSGADAPSGSLCICIDSLSGPPVLAASTLETEGTARRFALNMEDDRRSLLDDEDALCLTLEGSVLQILCRETSLRCRYRFLTEEAEEISGEVPCGQPVQITVPEQTFGTLELVFKG